MFASGKTSAASTGGYQISRSLRFNSADSAYLNRTPASAGNRRTWTFSAWVKRSALSGGNYPQLMSADGGTFGSKIGYFADDTFWVDVGQGATYTRLTSTAVYRDVSAWYHVVVAQDTTQATDTNRVKVYINGSQITLSGTYPTQNFDGSINNNSAQNIGRETSASYYFNGYMTEVNFIDGQALTPSSFGETNAQTGVWQPKAYSGSYGTNGFYLNFSDNSNTTAATLGKDYSGNGNNWTPSGFSVSSGAGNDSMVDTPTSYGTDTGVGGTVRGNYATLNPLIKPVGTVTYSDGNLVGTNSGSSWNAMGGTIGISTGKWYWEYTSPNQNSFFGIMVPTINFSSGNPQDANAAAGSVLLCDDNKYQIDFNARVSYTGTGHPAGTIVGVAVDMDAGTIVFYLNGTSQGSITWTSSAAYGKTVIPMAIAYDTATTTTANFGQRPFAYTAPSGFKALCTQNLPTPTIGATTATQAGKFFNTVVYNGANQTAQNITTVGFQPDFTWIKWRANTYYHNLFDVIRGVNNVLSTNVAVAEGIRPGTLTSFNSDGFSLGNDSTYSGVNIDATSYVAWNWKANGSGSTNTAGSITSTVSANTTSGFSVLTYTGTGSAATIGHGLGVAPSMLIFKSRSNSSENWNVYHRSLGTSNNILLNTTGAAFNDTAFINNTAPTSSVLSVGGAGSTGTNQGSGTYVCYAFAPIAGYSAFGSFTGNGSTDGAFVYTGFRPAFVMLKASSTGGAGYNWGMFDNDRLGYNSAQRDLRANLINDEGTDNNLIDFLSNGFKIRSTSGGFGGGSGVTYIYMAFAENPFKYSLARQDSICTHL